MLYFRCATCFPCFRLVKPNISCVVNICSHGSVDYSYLNDRRMLKEGGVTNKANIVNLQLKLLSTHVRFGGQDGSEDDVRKPTERITLCKTRVQDD